MTSLAVFWSEMLPAELLWQRTGQSLQKVREYCTLSWSWASIDAPVVNEWTRVTDYHFKESTSMGWQLEILEKEVSAQSNGQVSSAGLIVRGPLRKLYLPDIRKRLLDEGENGDRWVVDREERCGSFRELWALLVWIHVHNHYGLLLEPVPGQENTFQRVGYFEEAYLKRYWTGDQRVFDGFDLTKCTSTLVLV
jgi:hypothetical protein